MAFPSEPREILWVRPCYVAEPVGRSRSDSCRLLNLVLLEERSGGESRADSADEDDASVDWSRYVSFASTRRRADLQAVEHLKMLQHYNLAVKADNDGA